MVVEGGDPNLNPSPNPNPDPNQMVVEGGGGSRPTTAAADGADGAADEALEAHECLV